MKASESQRRSHLMSWGENPMACKSTQAPTRRVGTPKAEGGPILDRVQMVGLDGQGPQKGLDLVTGNKADPGSLGVPIDS